MTFSLARSFRLRNLALIVGLLVVAAIVVFVIQAVLAARALSAARTDASALAQSLSSGDLSRATVEAQALEKHAQSARSYTGGPLWSVGSIVPFLGGNVSAVRDTARALDVIATRSMPVLLKVAGQVEHGSLRPHRGRISPQAIAALAPEVRQAAAALDGPAAQIARIDVGGLIGPLQSPMRQVQKRVQEARTAIDAAANAFQVLPAMLGGSGPRNYLLLVQNPAEIRAPGGLPGTWAILRAVDGRLALTDAASAGAYTPKVRPIKATPDETALFGTDWGMTASDATVSPDFPRDAEMAAALAAQHGKPVSAVFSVDPIALSYVLRGTGPVKVSPTVTLTASNVVDVLLNQVYRTLNSDQQNAFYALAAGRIFDALVAGQGNQLVAIRGLVDGVQGHRVFAWSGDPTLAKVINAESLTGGFLGRTGSTPQVGVYLNDGVPGKQEYYLRQETSARAVSCRDDVQTIELKARFRSLMPANARTLPLWIVGTGAFAPKGHMFMTLYVAGPWQGSVVSVTIDGVSQTVTSNLLNGRQLAVLPLTIAPGQTVSMTATLQTGPGQSGAGQLTWTPGMTSGPDPVSFASVC